MGEYADALQRAYGLFGEREIDAAMDVFAEDVRWHGPIAQGLPDSGTFHGKHEVRWMFVHIRRTYGDDMVVSADEIVEDGDTAVVLGHLEAAPNGNRIKVPYAHVWRFEGGQGKRVHALFDTAAVMAALGG